MTYKRRSPMPVVEGGTGAQTLTGVLTGNGTSAITANAVTQYNVIVGGASNAVESVAPSATTGVPLVSQGAAANPAFGTAVVAGGGTGIVTTTAYAPICGGTTATGAFQAASTGLSTSGYVLTSNGASALPSFQAPAASGITTINGDTGSVTGSTVSIKGNGASGAGSTVLFSGSGTAMSLNVSDSTLYNTIIGLGAGNNTLTGTTNVGIGTGYDTSHGIFSALTNGNFNTGIGHGALNYVSSGGGNVAVGYTALNRPTTGSNNTAVGMQAYANASYNGSYSVGLGYQAGGNYTGSESHNVMINNAGVLGETNVLRIGNGTGTSTQQLNKAFISGITGITTGGASAVTMIDSSNQIGTVPGGAVTLNTGTQSLSLSSDASATTVNVGTGAAVKTVTLGSTNSTSATTVQSGSGALNITSTNGAMTINSGTGALSVSSDASATTVNLATGAAAKTVTLGSTNSTSSLALKYGTSDFTLASATGTVMSALDTGEVTFPLTSAFFARNTTSPTNVTGDGTNYTMTFTTEQFDLNSDYDGTSTFTAPITGRYTLGTSVDVSDLTASNTLGRISIVTTARTYDVLQVGIGKIFYVNVANLNGAIFVDMTAGDTATVQLNVAGSTKIVDIQGDYGNSPTYFYGRLDC